MTESSTRETSPLLVFLAWAFVGIPLLWGVAMALKSAVKLFQ